MWSVSFMCGLLSALAAGTVLAANSVVIDQVGPGSVEVRQSGRDNTVEIRQRLEEDKKEEDLKPADSGRVDYQRSIMGDATISERGRARSIIGEQTGEAPAILPNDKAAAAPRSNRIAIKQEGGRNRSVTVQEGEKNDLSLEQNGESNEYERTQEGEENHSLIIQNGEVVEDKGDNAPEM